MIGIFLDFIKTEAMTLDLKIFKKFKENFSDMRVHQESVRMRREDDQKNVQKFI